MEIEIEPSKYPPGRFQKWQLGARSASHNYGSRVPTTLEFQFRLRHCRNFLPWGRRLGLAGMLATFISIRRMEHGQETARHNPPEAVLVGLLLYMAVVISPIPACLGLEGHA